MGCVTGTTKKEIMVILVTLLPLLTIPAFKILSRFRFQSESSQPAELSREPKPGRQEQEVPTGLIPTPKRKADSTTAHQWAARSEQQKSICLSSSLKNSEYTDSEKQCYFCQSTLSVNIISTKK